MAQGGDGCRGDAAGTLHGPFIILLQEDCAGQAGDGGLVGEDADDLGAALDLAVEMKAALASPKQSGEKVSAMDGG